MNLCEEMKVKCVKENDFALNIDQKYEIIEIEFDNKTGEYSGFWLDDGSKNGLKLTIDEFTQFFEIPYSFEEDVIDPILNLIKDNQEYLTEYENLPQLAKLGFMYETLWYAGRVCWGYDGIIQKGGYDCEDNPKYKIEMCDPKNDKIENFIYDAWGMHVSNDLPKFGFEKFRKIIYEGRETTEFQKKLMKKNKTFDEWVEILTDKRNKYHSIYSDRKRVADHLLCTIGNGYGMNEDGFVISEASGADQDRDDYGDWQNAKFLTDIQKVVDDIMSKPQVKETLDKTHSLAIELESKRDKEQKANIKSFVDFDYFTQEEFDSMTYRELMDKIMEKHDKDPILNKVRAKKRYSTYYPICNYSIIDIMINPNSLKRKGIKNVHQSYIDAGIEICKEILAHEEEENKREGNVEFAKKFLALQGFDEYKEFIPKDVDVDSIMEEIKNNFSSVTYDKLYLNDSRINEYADDNMGVFIQTKPEEPMIMGISNDIEYIKGTKLYEVIKPAFEKTSKMKEVHQMFFYYENTDRFSVSIRIILNKKYVNLDKVKSDENFIKDGFMIGEHIMAKPLNNYIMVTSKSDPLGSKHPDNKEGKDYFSQAKYFHICDKNWNVLLNFQIDERGFNTFQAKTHNVKNDELLKLKNVLIEEFAKLKASDKSYGSYDSQTRNNKDEGKRKLYAFEFMNWMESKYSRKAKLDNLNGI